MTTDQTIATVSALFDGLSKIGIGAILGFLLQAYIERRRVREQRNWSVEDRDVGRKWKLSDRRIDERKEQLLAHKQFIDQYLKTLLAFSSRAYMRSIGLGKEESRDKLYADYLQSVVLLGEYYHHIEAFGNSELRQASQSLMQTIDDCLIPVLREPEKSQELTTNLVARIASATAPVTKKLENAMIEALQGD